MESWSFILSHMGAFIAGIALTGFLFWVLWKKVSRPVPSRTLPVSSWLAVFICIYFVALAAGFGVWLDGQDQGDFPWGLAMLLAGIAAVCIFAWYWMHKRTASLKIKRDVGLRS